MKARAALLLLAFLGTVANGLSSPADFNGIDVTVRVSNRFGRQLQQQVDFSALEGVVPLYQVPTVQPLLCPGPYCCQDDDYASPYRLQHLNSSQTEIAGRTYTTFYLNLMTQQHCNTQIDAAGCCQSDIQTIWVDVDPELKVLFAAMNGNPSAVAADQSQLGLRMTLAQPLATVPSTGALISITVEGPASQLCALPDLAPVSGLCNIIIEGGTADNAAACCPRSLSKAASGVYVPEPFVCVSDIQRSAYNLGLQSVTPAFTNDEGSSWMSNYTFLLQAPASCVAGANSCCNMDLSSVQLKISATADVAFVQIANTPAPFVTSAWGEPGFQSLMIHQLTVAPSSVPSNGLPLLVTVRLPTGTTAVPHLCTEAANGVSYGPCSYFLQSGSGFCCPSSATSSVLLGSNIISPPPPAPPLSPGAVASSPPPSVVVESPPFPPPSPPSPPSPPPLPTGTGNLPPPGSLPPSPPGHVSSPPPAPVGHGPSPPPSPTGSVSPPPAVSVPPSPPGQGSPSPPNLSPVTPGSCNPSLEAPLTETSMGLQYYEGPMSVGSATQFVFMVSDHNGPQCTKSSCQDVCGWTLFVEPTISSELTFLAEDPANSNKQVVTSEAIMFTYGPSNEGTLLYTISVPRQVSLDKLCRPNALPGQGSKACAAIIKGPNVYSTVFFDQSDVIITSSPPPSLPLDFCADNKPMSQSCVRVDSAVYNAPDSASMVFDFSVSNHGTTSSTCTANGEDVRFMVLLTPAVASKLATTQATLPGSAAFNLEGSSSGVAWKWTNVTAPGTPVHYTFRLNSAMTPDQVCAQGVLSNQVPGSCVVVILGNTCFSGYVVATVNTELTWGGDQRSSDGGSSSSSVIGPAVGVPLGVLLAGCIAFFAVAAYRRKKNFAAAAAAGIVSGDSFDNLAAPLRAGSNASVSGSRGSVSIVSERTPSDVQIRLPSSSAR